MLVALEHSLCHAITRTNAAIPDTCHAVEQGISRPAANCSPTPGSGGQAQGQREIQDDHRDTKAVT